MARSNNIVMYEIGTYVRMEFVWTKGNGYVKGQKRARCKIEKLTATLECDDCNCH